MLFAVGFAATAKSPLEGRSGESERRLKIMEAVRTERGDERQVRPFGCRGGRRQSEGRCLRIRRSGEGELRYFECASACGQAGRAEADGA
jgi:hypothetical protein